MAASAATDDRRATSWLPPPAGWALPLLAALTLGLYWQTLRSPFVFDDLPGIVENPHIRTLLPLSRSLGAPDGSGASGRPVVALSLALNYALGGLDVRGYRLTNLAVHALCGAVLLGLVRRTLPGLGQDRRRADGIAWTCALLWLVHPLQTDALNHVIYRNESLAALFFLSTLYGVARAAESQRAAGWVLFTVGACALGMGSKETMAAAPLVALLYDRAYWAGSLTGALRARPMLHAGCAATWLILAMCVGFADRGESVAYWGSGSAVGYAALQTGVLLHYMRLAIWPHPLIFDYGDAPPTDLLAPPWLSVPLVLALLVVVLGATWRRPRIGTPALAFVLLLAPTTSFIPIAGETVAEHRMYLPLAGMVLAAAALAQGVPAAPRAIATGVVLAILAATTVARNRVYESDQTLWEDTVAKRPTNGRAHGTLAVLHGAAGRFEQSERHARLALELNQQDDFAHANLAAALLAQGREEPALAELRTALALRPTSAKWRLLSAELLLRVGRANEAILLLEEGMRVGHDSVALWEALGAARMETGDSAGAADALRRVLELDPNRRSARIELARAHGRLGETAAALGGYREVLRVEPDHVEALNNLAWLLATRDDRTMDDAREAVSAARRATALAPERPQLWNTLAFALDAAGNASEAHAALDRAIELAADAELAAALRGNREALSSRPAGEAATP